MERHEGRKKATEEWVMQQTTRFLDKPHRFAKVRGTGEIAVIFPLEHTAEDMARGKALCLPSPKYDDIQEIVELEDVSVEKKVVNDSCEESIMETGNRIESSAMGIYDATILAHPTQPSLGFTNQLGHRQQNVSGGGDQDAQRISNEMNNLHIFDGSRYINERPPRRALFPGGFAAATRIARGGSNKDSRSERLDDIGGLALFQMCADD